MGRSLNGTDSYSTGSPDELPEHDAQVADFYLDTFEVTVARFRPFVLAYPSSLPKDGDGAHPKKADTGWHTEWAAQMPQTRDDFESALSCPPGSGDIGPTYTAIPGAGDKFPINCVSWYEAFAFCVWEGRRLPTEAEWEYAAAGGNENRRYPWGEAVEASPSLGEACIQPSCVGQYKTLLGVSRWGNFDLAGSLFEYVLDTPLPYSAAPCTDCITFDPQFPIGAARGGCFKSHPLDLRAATRFLPAGSPLAYSSYWGFRCARSP